MENYHYHTGCLPPSLELAFIPRHVHAYQWRRQNAEKVTQFKGRLQDQAMILFNCALFQIGNFS